MTTTARPGGELVRDATNAFAVRLYLQLAEQQPGENLFFSPYSVLTALTMAAHGARGETALEMGTALAYPETVRQQVEETPWDTRSMLLGLADVARSLDPADAREVETTRQEIASVRAEFEAADAEAQRLREARDWDGASRASDRARSLARRLNELLAQVDQYEIHVANALWCEQTYPFEPDYLESIEAVDEDLGLFGVDFRHGFEEARARINEWIEQRTQERIQDLVPPGALDRYTRLVLTNAIYFKGEWAEPFDPAATRTEPFLLADGTSVSTPLMQERTLEQARYGAFESDGSSFDTPRQIDVGQTTGLYPDAGFQVVELAYKGGRLSMVLVVPQRPDGLSSLEAGLSAGALNGWVEQLQTRPVHVGLPRFELDTSYGLKPPLRSMGMVRAFVDPAEQNGADFSAMSQARQRSEWLYITAVLHKAFLEVNEKGTEAAAATAVVMAEATSLPVRMDFTPTVRADRPFLFLIRDRETGAVLFLGRFVAPDA